MATLRPHYSKEEFARRGDVIFERDIKPPSRVKIRTSSSPSISKPVLMRWTRTKWRPVTVCARECPPHRHGCDAWVRPTRIASAAADKGSDHDNRHGHGETEIVIRLEVHGPTGRKRSIKAVIDTGFDGCLTLPKIIITLLRLPWDRRERCVLADGSQSVFDVYKCDVFWDNRLRSVAVASSDIDPLVGMQMLDGYKISADIRPGRKVTIKRPRRP